MSQESPFWTIFGKASAVLTSIATVIGIWVVINQTSEDLELHVVSQPYIVSPDLKEDLSKHFSTFSPTNLRARFKSSDLPKEVIENEFALVNFIRDLHSTSWGMDDIYSSYRIPSYRGYNYLVLANKGDKIATDIAIDFPEKGIALIINPDNSRTLINFNRVIKVSDLRANNEVVLVIWSETELSTYRHEEINVTHKNGVGEVTWPIEATGISWYVKNYSFLTLLFIYLIFMLGMALGSSSGSQDNKKEPVDDKSA